MRGAEKLFSTGMDSMRMRIHTVNVCLKGSTHYSNNIVYIIYHIFYDYDTVDYLAATSLFLGALLSVRVLFVVGSKAKAS